MTSLKDPKQNNTTLPAAGFMTLLGCWLYDFMLLCAVWLLAGIAYIIPAQMIAQVDSSATNNLSTTEFTGPLFYSYLFFVSWFFFAWFWIPSTSKRHMTIDRPCSSIESEINA